MFQFDYMQPKEDFLFFKTSIDWVIDLYSVPKVKSL